MVGGGVGEGGFGEVLVTGGLFVRMGWVGKGVER